MIGDLLHAKMQFHRSRMSGIKIISHQCTNANREYIKLSAKEVDSLPVKIFQISKSL